MREDETGVSSTNVQFVDIIKYKILKLYIKFLLILFNYIIPPYNQHELCRGHTRQATTCEQALVYQIRPTVLRTLVFHYRKLLLQQNLL